jgi:hypothetical protein
LKKKKKKKLVICETKLGALKPSLKISSMFSRIIPLILAPQDGSKTSVVPTSFGLSTRPSWINNLDRTRPKDTELNFGT